MAVKIPFDSAMLPIMPTFVLATRGGEKLGMLPVSHLHFADEFASKSDMQFVVYKYNNDVELDIWDQIVDFKLVWCPEWDIWYEISVEINETNTILKNVSCATLGVAELSQIKIYNTEINTEEDIAREDYVPTTLYNASNPSASLLNRILEKAPHYSIKHVDSTIAQIQRTFSFDNKGICDVFKEVAEEIGCLFVYNSGTINGAIERSISVYDLESNCEDCGFRGEFDDVCPNCGGTSIQKGYGDDTNILATIDNIASEIGYSSDTASVKNCFRLVAGDDLMTATIANCNPNGSSYIWHITDETMSDMSSALRGKVNDYNALYEYYRNENEVTIDSTLLASYNALVTKYQVYKPELRPLPQSFIGYSSLMDAYYDTIDFNLLLQSQLMPSPQIPETSAAMEAAKLTTANLSPIGVTNINTCSNATATSAVLSIAKTVIDPRYQVKVASSSYQNYVWSGVFTVTNYADETDTATTATINIVITGDYETYVKQRIEKILSQDSDYVTNISDLFKLSNSNFAAAIKRYCLNSLVSFQSACQSCIDILVEQGIANDETWASEANNLYNNLYTPYYQKLQILEAEVALREYEISIVAGVRDVNDELLEDGVQTLIMHQVREIQSALDFEKYLGETLWKEFAAYRREDTYQNDNFISEGLTTAELFENAREFINVASSELFKASTLQHSISSKLKNLLVIEAFKPIIKNFKIGNWIRIMVDGKICKLRLLRYEIDFDNLSNIDVGFSDVKQIRNGLSDLQSILNNASTMSSSYEATIRQVEQNKKAKKIVNDWVNKGLDMTQAKIVSSATDQNISWDEHGILCRQFDSTTDSYDDRQLKIINRGLYVTDNNWLTSKAGIGDFIFYNPETGQMEEAYGVIADTLVGNLILSQKVGIYNEGNTIKLDENGITLISDVIGRNTDVFKVQKKYLDNNDNEVVENVIYFDNEGNANFVGKVTASSLRIVTSGSTSVPISDYVDDKVDDALDSTVSNVDIEYGTSQSSTTPPSNWSTSAPTWSSNVYIWSRTKITKGDNSVSYEPSENGVCIQAAAARSIYLTGEQLFIKDSLDDTITPTSITLTASVSNLTVGKWYYRNAQSSWVEITASEGQSTCTITPTSPSAGWVQNKIVIKVEDSTGAYSDIMTVAMIESGATGESASNTILSNENISFSADSTGKLAGRTLGIFLSAYTGSTAVLPVATISNSSQLPSWLTVSMTSNTSTHRIDISVSATNNAMATQDSGVIELAITSPIATTAQINWSVIKNGADGAPAVLHELDVSDLVIVKSGDNGVYTYSPNGIRLSAQQIVGNTSSSYSGYYVVDFINSIGTITTVRGSGTSWTASIPQNIDLDSVECSLYSNSSMASLLDYQTIRVIGDGARGANGSNASIAFLTNESIGFSANSLGIVSATTATCNVVAYDGTTKVTPTVDTANIRGEISGQLSISVGTVTNNEIPLTITVSNNVTLNNQTSGTIQIPVSYPVATTLTINWTKISSGRGILSTEIKYAEGTNGTTPPSSGWGTSVPTVDAGNYLWTRTVTSFSDNTSTTAYSVSKQGQDGTSVNILGSYDTLSELRAAHPTGSPGDAYIVGLNLYIWSDSDSDWIDVGQIKGEDGDPGTSVSITSTDVSYVVSTSGDSVPASTANWQSTVPTVDPGKYLWTRTQVAFSDNTSITSYSVSRNGTNGQDGRGISNVQEYYAASTSATSAPASADWKTLAQAQSDWGASKIYLWNSETITYTSGNPDTYSNPHVVAIFTEDGKNGRGISQVINWYVTNDTTDPTGSSSWSWSTSITPVSSTAKYLWNYEEVTYDDSSPSTKTTPCIIGNYANDGMPGYSTVVVYLYKRSTTAVAIDWTTQLTYTFATDTLSSIPTGWTRSIAAATGNGDLYVTAATASSTGASDTIAYQEWASPVLFSKIGENGLNSATVMLYKRSSSSTLAIPTGTITYTFSSGAITEQSTGALNGWTKDIPTDNGTPAYVIQATAISTDSYDTITTSEWSSPVKLVESGTSYYTWIVYATSDTPATSDIHTTKQPDDTYIGIAHNKTTSSPGPNVPYTSYTWARIEGVGISSIIEQYLLFHSNADGAVTSGSPTAEEIEYYKTAAGGGHIYDEYWSDTCPIWQSGYYIWTRSKIVWDDSSVTYSTPVLAEGLNSANSVANSAQGSANEITKVVQSNQDRIDSLDTDVDDLKTNAENIIRTITDFQVQQEGINATVTTVNNQMIEVQNNLSFDANGLTLGKSNDKLKVVITNSRMSFKDGDDEVAYISNNQLYITQANIRNKIITGEYAFVPSPSHLSLVYNG